MIRFIHPNQYCHTDRSYLTRWFLHDTLVITDVDVNQEQELESLVRDHPCKRWLLDLSHNGMALDQRPPWLEHVTTLTTEWTDWYQPRGPNIHYFPLWFYMYSLRLNQWFQPTIFDAGGAKSRPMMCLNRNPHPHRVRFAQLIEPIRSSIVYTLGDQTLPGESVEAHSGMVPLDISVGHPVYSECAVNIVTETKINWPTLSEKTCKPFVARQIPVIVGPRRCNQFLSDIGLDMFDDLVPWRTWDDETDDDLRLEKIADFLVSWVQSGTILEDYRRVTARVERNKQYFHSEQFRDLVLKHMPKVDPFAL